MPVHQWALLVIVGLCVIRALTQSWDARWSRGYDDKLMAMSDAQFEQERQLMHQRGRSVVRAGAALQFAIAAFQISGGLVWPFPAASCVMGLGLLCFAERRRWSS